MKFKPIKYIDRKTGNILIEQVPAEKYLKFLYYNPFGKLSLNLFVKRKFFSEYYGRKMHSPKSINKIVPFIKETGIDIKEAKKGINDFKSFNDFFCRELKKEARKIDKNDNILVSPADGRLLVFENLNEEKKIYIKGSEFTLKNFFNDKILAKEYQDSTFIIIRLAPGDYHRFHFPIDGFINKSTLINGVYYSVSTHAIRKNFNIFCENKREYSILKTKKFDDIAIIEIGATMVGGIKQTYTSNTIVKKGEEKGYFYFGGSTCVLVLKKNIIKIDHDLIENTKRGFETKICMGERIGITLNKL